MIWRLILEMGKGLTEAGTAWGAMKFGSRGVKSCSALAGRSRKHENRVGLSLFHKYGTEGIGEVSGSHIDDGLASYPGDCRSVMVDCPFTIRLWEDRTRGEQWVPVYDSKGLALLSDDFHRIASNNAVENGQRIFEFKAVRPGVYQLAFEKRMGWKYTTEDRRLFRIEVAPSVGR